MSETEGRRWDQSKCERWPSRLAGGRRRLRARAPRRTGTDRRDEND